MTTTIDELLGSKRGVAETECNPSIMKRMAKAFRKLCRTNHHYHVNNHHGGTICIVLTENTREEIAQLIMENTNHINQQQP